MDSCGNAHFSRCSYNGAADITAEAYNNIGLEFPENLLDAEGAEKKIEDSLKVADYIFNAYFSLKARNFNCGKIKACCGYELSFHFILCADKQNFSIGISFSDFTCSCKCGVDVATGTACSK